MKVHSSDSGSRMRGWLRDRSLVGRAISATLVVALYSLGMLYLGAFHRSDMAELDRIIARAPTAILNRTVAAFTANPTMIRLDLSHRSYQKLAFKRERALAKRRLITSDDDWVSADLSVDDVTVYVGRRAAGTTLHPETGNHISLPAVVRYDTMGWSNRSLPPAVEYHLSGELLYVTPGELAEILLDTGVRKPRVRFSRAGRLDLPSN